MSLKTKNVFLTGGARGMGKAFTEALLTAGARVVFVDINVTTGAATEADLQEKYGASNVKFLQLDVRNKAQLQETFATAVDFLGHVNLYVNNAGILNESDPEAMIQVNVTAVANGTLMAYEHMRKDRGGRGGRIVNISSVVALEESLVSAFYCGTKQANRAFTSSLALNPRLKEQGVEFAVLCPGPTDTDFLASVSDVTVRHFDLVDVDLMYSIASSVERITEAFMKLVQLEEMNGAVLNVNKTEMEFCRMEKVSLGDNWPPAQADNQLESVVDKLTKTKREEIQDQKMN